MSDENDYATGFGKPPRKHQFKPGQSGNPKGRPKGSRNLASIFHEISNQRVKVKDSSGTRYMSKIDAIITQLTNKAVAGDLKAAREYLRLSQSLPVDPKSLPRQDIMIRFIEAEDGRPKYPEELRGTVFASPDEEKEEYRN